VKIDPLKSLEKVDAAIAADPNPRIGVAVDDPEAHYLYSYRSAAIFKYDAAGRCLGEDTYSDGYPTLERVRKLASKELPDPRTPR